MNKAHDQEKQYNSRIESVNGAGTLYNSQKVVKRD